MAPRRGLIPEPVSNSIPDPSDINLKTRVKLIFDEMRRTFPDVSEPVKACWDEILGVPLNFQAYGQFVYINTGDNTLFIFDGKQLCMNSKSCMGMKGIKIMEVTTVGDLFGQFYIYRFGEDNKEMLQKAEKRLRRKQVWMNEEVQAIKKEYEERIERLKEENNNLKGVIANQADEIMGLKMELSKIEDDVLNLRYGGDGVRGAEGEWKGEQPQYQCSKKQKLKKHEDSDKVNEWEGEMHQKTGEFKEPKATNTGGKHVTFGLPQNPAGSEK